MSQENITFHDGKVPFVESEHDVKFGDFLPDLVSTGLLPTPPSQFGHGNDFLGEAWLMLGNGPDNTVSPGFVGEGNCFWAGLAHQIMAANYNAGKPVPKFTGKVAIDQYHESEGPGDNGSEPRKGLEWIQKKGYRDANGNVHHIGPYMLLETKNLDELFYSNYLLEGTGVGIEFPGSAMQQTNEGKPWVPVPGAQIEGGHWIYSTGRPGLGWWALISWAMRRVASDPFYTTYNDESWGIIMPESFKAVTGRDFEGYDASQTEEFLHLTARAKAALR